MGFNLVNFWKV